MKKPDLNRSLVLETPVSVPDGAGGFSETWEELGRHWAEVRPGTGREKAADFVTLSTVPYRITVRAAAPGGQSRPGAEQRFRDGDRIYRILAVTERDPSARYLLCFCREEVLA